MAFQLSSFFYSMPDVSTENISIIVNSNIGTVNYIFSKTDVFVLQKSFNLFNPVGSLTEKLRLLESYWLFNCQASFTQSLMALLQ